MAWRGTHGMEGYPWHGGVPMAWRGTHGMEGYPWHGGVPMAWRGTHGMEGYPWHGGVPMAWRGTHGMEGYPWHGGVPMAWRGTHGMRGGVPMAWSACAWADAAATRAEFLRQAVRTRTAQRARVQDQQRRNIGPPLASTRRHRARTWAPPARAAYSEYVMGSTRGVPGSGRPALRRRQ